MSTRALPDPGQAARAAIEEKFALIARNAFIAGYLASRPNVSREVIAGMADEYVAGMLEARRQLANGEAEKSVFDPTAPSVRLLS